MGKRTYILKRDKNLENIPAIEKEKKKRAQIEEKFGRMSDMEYFNFKKKFLS